jgi:PAS domain S-box-containing protein
MPSAHVSGQSSTPHGKEQPPASGPKSPGEPDPLGEELYRLVVENSSDFITIWDEHGTAVYDNPAAQRLIVETRKAAHSPLHIGALAHPDDHPRIRAAFEAVRDAGGFRRIEYRLQLRDQEIRWIDALVIAVPGTNSKTNRVIWIRRDITQLRGSLERLRESQERFRRLADNTHDIFALIGLDGEYQYLSQSFYKLFGIGRDEAGKVGNFIHADDRERVLEQIRELLTKGISQQTEYRVLLPNGEIAWLEALAEPVLDAQNAIVGASVVARDVSARRQVEQAPAESESKYRLLADNQTDYVQLVDVDGRILYDSPSVIRLLGSRYRPYRSFGQEGNSLIHPDDLEVARRTMRELQRQGGEVHVEYRWLLPSGEVRWIDAKVAAITGVNGEVDKFLGVSRDITQRKLAELALADSEKRYRILADHSEDFIQLLDATGQTLFRSPSIARALGYEVDLQQPAPGRQARSALEMILPEDRPRVEQALARVRSDATIQTVEFRIEMRPGSVRWLEAIGKPVDDPASGSRLVLVVSRDITKRKRAEELAYQAQKLESLGMLTGGLAHDFNNLLGVMIGNLDMLEEQMPQEPGLLKRLGVARDAALKAAQVTRSMLAIARRQPMIVVLSDLNVLVANDEPLIATSVGRSCQVSLELTDAPLPVACDPNAFSNALLNLVINARDAMKEIRGAGPALIVRTGREVIGADSELASGEYGVVSVIDNGVGMSADVIGKVFDPFFTTKSRDQGSGLGLSMVYGYARQSGGTVRIESSPGQGTTVKIYLPIAVTQAGQDAAALSAQGIDTKQENPQ